MDINDIRDKIDSGVMTTNVEETIIANDIMKEFFEVFEQEKLGEMVTRSNTVGSHVAMGILEPDEVDHNASNVENLVVTGTDTEKQCEKVPGQEIIVSNDGGNDDAPVASGSNDGTAVVENKPNEGPSKVKRRVNAAKERPLFSLLERKIIWTPRKAPDLMDSPLYKVAYDGEFACERMCSCIMCPYQTPRESHMMCHVKVHGADRYYNCHVCHFKTTDKKKITQHSRIHSGEKPYTCEVCGKAFPQDSTLTRHMKVHAAKKVFKCDVCSKKFDDKDEMKKHKQEHKTKKLFLCDICDKTMNLKTEFKRHVKFHSAKPYRCEECDSCFAVESTLRRHQLVHTGKKPYHCDDCDKGFSLKANYRRHLKTH